VSAPLFRRLLGPAMDTLPTSLRAVHDQPGTLTLAGTAQVWRSPNPLARLLCNLMRLPAERADVPVSVAFERNGDRERWHRRFGERAYSSRLSSRGGLLVERMGPATNIFRVGVAAERLHLDLMGFRFLGVPLPSILRPHCHAIEADEAGAFTFDIPVTLPGLGPVIRYSGWLASIGCN
jgi:hypothetical protein